MVWRWSEPNLAHIFLTTRWHCSKTAFYSKLQDAQNCRHGKIGYHFTQHAVMYIKRPVLRFFPSQDTEVSINDPKFVVHRDTKTTTVVKPSTYKTGVLQCQQTEVITQKWEKFKTVKQLYNFGPLEMDWPNVKSVPVAWLLQQASCSWDSHMMEADLSTGTHTHARMYVWFWYI